VDDMTERGVDGDPSDDPSGGEASTLPAAWSGGWARTPDAPVLRQAGGGWWTAGALDDATRRAAGRLAGFGLAPGDRVLWSTGSSVAAVVAHVGALRAGLVVVPANTAYTRREIAHIATTVRPAAAVVDDPVVGRWADEALGGGVRVLSPALDGPDRPTGPLDAASPGDPALICFTSGTTGAPKGAVLSHGNLLAGSRSLATAWGWTSGDRLVHCLPLFHAHGLCVGLYGTLLAGGSAVLLPGFDPAAVVDEASDPASTLFFGVPTMYHRLLADGRVGPLGRLRLCVSGSAPLPAAMHAALTTALGSAPLERYGMTETLMITSNPLEGERRAGSVGLPLPGVGVRLAGDGEILVRGPAVTRGYRGDPAATAEAFVDDLDGGRPWFRTGDLGSCSDDGYLSILGRSKELILSGGFNVYPAEVEDVLAGCPGVVEVAVTGTPSDEWGEVVTAWVVADGTSPTERDVVAHAERSLAPYKRPRLVRFVDELPRNALGKVVRSELRN